MPAEDQAVQATAEMVKGGIQLLVEISGLLARQLSHYSGRTIRPLKTMLDAKTHQSPKRLQLIADQNRTSVEQFDITGLNKTDERLKEATRLLDKSGTRWAIVQSQGACFLEVLSNQEQKAIDCCKRAGIALGGKLVNKIDTPSEQLARAKASMTAAQRTPGEAGSSPIFTIETRTRPYDIRAGILKQNLDLLGIKSIVQNEGYTTRITIRQTDAKAVKTLIDSLSDDRAFTHFERGRIQNYEQLARAASQTQPVMQQDPGLMKLLGEEEHIQPQHSVNAPGVSRSVQTASHDTLGTPATKQDITATAVRQYSTASREQPGKLSLKGSAVRLAAKKITAMEKAREAQAPTRVVTRGARQAREEGPTR